MAASGWVRQQLPDTTGLCYCDRFSLDNGLVLVRSRYRPAMDLAEESVNQEGSGVLAITLGLEGESRYVGSDGFSLDFQRGYTTVSSFHHSAGERHYQAGSSVAQLRLLVDATQLGRYGGAERSRQLLPTANVRQLAWRKTTPSSAAHACALMRWTDSEAPDVLGLQIHALSLLAEQLHGLCPVPVSDPRLGPADIDKLHRAHGLMQSQMNGPLTIAYLCASVGLSEFHLKRGFHYLFNGSPHRVLLEMRMRRAWTLLEAGCQVAQAAWQVGYEHPSNFSAAFTKFFGRSPKSVFGKQPAPRPQPKASRAPESPRHLL